MIIVDVTKGVKKFKWHDSHIKKSWQLKLFNAQQAAIVTTTTSTSMYREEYKNIGEM